MFEHVMFIRPWWLLAFIPAVALVVLQLKRAKLQSDWQSIIAPKFQPWLLGGKHQPENSRLFGLETLGLLTLWCAAVIALAGPSWQSQTLPAQPNTSGSIIVLDLTQSMYADDLNPNRITRAQFKLTDLIKQHPELQLGLVAYAGSPHIISPLSQDPATLLNLLPHLTPSIMPRLGANPVAAMDLAITMLDQSAINQHHIIWITDDVESNEIDPIVQRINQHNIQLSILSVGTQQGGVIHHPELGLIKDSQDQLIIVPVPEQRLAQIAQQTNGRYNRLRLDDQDIASLVPTRSPAARTDQAEANQQVKHPVDFGVYLVLIMVVIAMFALRRGWLLSLGPIALMASILSLTSVQPVWANEEADAKPHWLEKLVTLFMTGDQRGYQAWQAEDYLTAEREFNHQQWHASSLYRLGGYDRAAEVFSKDTSARGQYNLANSLALAGQLDAALAAYDRALALEPDFTQAQENRDLIQQLSDLQPEAQPQANVPMPSQNNNEGEDEGGGGQAATEESDQAQEEGQSGEGDSQDGKQDASQESTPAANSDNSSEGDTSQNKTNQTQANEQIDPGLIREDNDPVNEEDATEDDAAIPGQQRLGDGDQPYTEQERELSNQTWLNQIQDNPGRFLQRKFQYQIQREAQSSPSTVDNSGSKTW